MSRHHADAVSVITGASRGIGRALALQLGQDKGVVVITYRTRIAEAEEVVAEIRASGGQAVALRMSAEEPTELQAVFDHVEREYGRLDLFVSNVAAAPFKSVKDLTQRHLDRCHAANSRAFALGSQRAADLMDRGGRILAMTSLGSRFAMPGYAAMGSEKAATESWVRYLACGYADQGITVNAVCAGFVDTESLTVFAAAVGIDLEEFARRTPQRRLGKVEDVVAAAMFLMSPEAGHITGQILHVDGGMSAGLATDFFLAG